MADAPIAAAIEFAGGLRESTAGRGSTGTSSLNLTDNLPCLNIVSACGVQFWPLPPAR